jgi:hypothetical protein
MSGMGEGGALRAALQAMATAVRALNSLHLRKLPEAPEAQIALMEALVVGQRFHLVQVPLHRRRRHRMKGGDFPHLASVTT